jgi:hypothetical protein
MKGTIMLIVVCAIVWAFWMSWQWLRKPKDDK